MVTFCGDVMTRHVMNSGQENGSDGDRKLPGVARHRHSPCYASKKSLDEIGCPQPSVFRAAFLNDVYLNRSGLDEPAQPDLFLLKPNNNISFKCFFAPAPNGSKSSDALALGRSARSMSESRSAADTAEAAAEVRFWPITDFRPSNDEFCFR